MAEAPWFKFYIADWLVGTRGLEMATIGVYITLLTMMYEKEAPLSEDTGKLARYLGARKPTIEKAIRLLIADGKIVQTKHGLWNDRVQKEIENRKQRSSIAKNNASARWEKIEENQQPENASAMQQPCKTNAISESESESDIRGQNKGDSISPRPVKSKAAKVDDAEFDQFWRVYPRREAKGAARRAYEKARKSVTAETILEGATRYAKERAFEDPKYTKHPATWLSGECWGDEPRQPHIIAPGHDTGLFGGNSYENNRVKTPGEQVLEMIARMHEEKNNERT